MKTKNSACSTISNTPLCTPPAATLQERVGSDTQQQGLKQPPKRNTTSGFPPTTFWEENQLQAQTLGFLQPVKNESIHILGHYFCFQTLPSLVQNLSTALPDKPRSTCSYSVPLVLSMLFRKQQENTITPAEHQVNTAQGKSTHCSPLQWQTSELKAGASTAFQGKIFCLNIKFGVLIAQETWNENKQ